MRTHAIAAVTLLALGTVAAPAAQPKSCRPTLADYEAIGKGERLKAVAARLGCRGERVSGMRIGKRHTVTYSWRGRGSYGANLTLTFTNGKLTDKSQLGLH